MLDHKYVAENLDAVRGAVGRRSSEATRVLDELATAAAERHVLVTETERKQAERNSATREMSALVKRGDPSVATREKLKVLSKEVKQLTTRLRQVDEELAALLMAIPNMPDASTPDGHSTNDDTLVRTWGAKPTFAFRPKPYAQLDCAAELLDFERADRLSGPRFCVAKGRLARLQRVLVQYMLDVHTRQHDYEEVSVPYLLRASAFAGTADLPPHSTNLFRTHRDDSAPDRKPLYLIPAAQVALTALHSNEILEVSDLPKAYCAFTPSFLNVLVGAEAVSDLETQHQLHQVQLVRLVAPEHSFRHFEMLLGHAEAILQGLGLHYRVSEVCAGRLDFAATKSFDLDVWFPGEERYRTISRCNHFGSFQARRAQIRFRPAPKAKPQPVHTLAGAALAVERTLAAIMAQFQSDDGGFRLPDVLQSYANGLQRLGA